MPILIDEVVISVQVENPPSGDSKTPVINHDNQRQLIQECVEQVLDVLKQREEP